VNLARSGLVKNVSKKTSLVAALWLVAVAIGIGIILGPGRLWGHKHHPSAVAAYITRVDAAEQQMHAPLTQLLTVYRTYSTHKTGGNEQAQLAKSARTLRTLQQRLLAIPAPPAATKLRTLLVQFVGTERDVALEIAQLARFLPRFRALSAAAAVANNELSRSLAATKPPRAHAVRGTAKQIAAARAAYAAAARAAQAHEADAIDAYNRVLALVLRNMATLRAPAVIATAYRAEIGSLQATRTAGEALSAELRKSSATRVPALSRKFDAAARLSGSIAAQRAEIEAVKAYDSRVRGLGRLQARIQAEVLRLQQAGA
jgi:hypothetical protein